MKSIRVKIAAITVIAILTSILSVFASCYPAIQRENDRNSVNTMNLIGRDTQKSLEKYLNSIEQSVEMAANIASDSLDSVVLLEYGAAGASAGQTERTHDQIIRLDEYLGGYCAQLQTSFATIASHTHGIVTYYYCINPEISETEHGFFYSKVGKTGFDRQEPLDARQLDPEDIAHTTWYYTPIQRGRPSWVGPYTAHFLNEMWIYSYLVPIYKAGAMIGVLGMDISCDTLIAQVSAIRVYETGFACLLDADGRVMYHPAAEFGSKLEQSDISIDSELLKRESSGTEMIRYTANGEERQLAFFTLSNGMKLLISAPVEEINLSWTQMAKIILTITVLVTVFYAILLLFVMRVITRPLKRLTAAARKLAAEDYDVELNYQSQDEIGELTNAFQRMRDQLKRDIEDLNRRVHTDALTNLPNMRHFFQLAETERRRLAEDGKRPSLLYFNLIGMKHYNRQYGFEEGDRLICATADVLRRRYGEQHIGRLSEDHFAAIAEKEHLEDGLRAVFQECQGINGGKTLPIRVGVYADWGEDIKTSIACDRAKYACDQQRGAFVSGFYYFDKNMLSELETVRYIVRHLDQALREQWIKVYYQPIIRAVSGRVCDEEALCRWIDPQKGMLSPADFIPVLENARLIYKLDLYVLDRVLEKIKCQRETGLTIVPHSINLSRSDFDACDMVEEIRRRVDASGVDRRMITIEITESIIGSDFDFIKEQVNRFQQLGFPVWMDDFGSGYSSLDVLQSIRFDLIKFDMSFMKRLDENESGKIILTELMKMAIALGVDTVCEGVETEAQVQFLQEIGCSKLQGFYYCKPIPFESILERYSGGYQIGYESPAEGSYFDAIGRVNLFDLKVITSKDDNAIQNYFNSLPMAILEIREGKMRFVRFNQSYRDFFVRLFGFELAKNKTDYADAAVEADSAFLQLMRRCSNNPSRVFLDDHMPDGTVVHSMARRIAVNPVNGTVAIALAVLSISGKNDQE
ncbi:MAG: EAL domain-containing protein [Clostridia bacterium]|nr:EAL domain-containing protein [Clostridia bacterium]